MSPTSSREIWEDTTSPVVVRLAQQYESDLRARPELRIAGQIIRRFRTAHRLCPKVGLILLRERTITGSLGYPRFRGSWSGSFGSALDPGAAPEVFQDPLHGPLADPEPLADLPAGEPLRLELQDRPPILGQQLAEPAEDLAGLGELARGVVSARRTRCRLGRRPRAAPRGACPACGWRHGDTRRSPCSSQPGPGRRQGAANPRTPSARSGSAGRSCPRRSGGSRASRTATAAAEAIAAAPPGAPPPRTGRAARGRPLRRLPGSARGDRERRATRRGSVHRLPSNHTPWPY